MYAMKKVLKSYFLMKKGSKFDEIWVKNVGNFVKNPPTFPPTF